MEGRLAREVAVSKAAYFGMVPGKFEESAGGVGRFGRELAGAGEDEGVDGAPGGAPGIFGGVAHVSRCKLLEGGVVHASGVGEDGCWVGGGGSHGGDCNTG